MTLKLRKAKSNMFIPRVNYKPVHVEVITYPQREVLPLMKPFEYDDKYLRVHVRTPEFTIQTQQVNRIFVWCGNAREFESWCSQNDVCTHDKRFICLIGPEQLMGIENPTVLRYGSWDRNKNARQMFDAIKMMTR